MNEKNVLSVIIILYNRKPSKQLMYCLSHLKRQTINTEIIICEQNKSFDLEFDVFCNKNEINHIKVSSNNAFENMGYLKNLGIKKASGKYVYFLDSDMIILNDDYFEKIINFMEKDNCRALVHPRMLRLKKNVDELVNGNHIINYQNSNNCYCDYNSEGNTLEFNYKEQYKFFNNLTHVSIDNNLWQLNFHSGSIFIRKDDLIDLGGYSQVYYHWGMDDIDTQWKINESLGARNIFELFPNLYVLHFEHPVFNENEDHKKNREIFKKRFNHGVEKAVKYDKTAFLE